MAMSKLPIVIVMECSSLSASSVRVDFKCCRFWLFVSLVLSITAPLNKSNTDFLSKYPTEKTGKLNFGKLTFTSVVRLSLVKTRVGLWSLRRNC